MLVKRVRLFATHALVAFLAVLVLSGCLDIVTELDLRRTTDIVVTHRFTIATDAWEFGRGPLGTGQGMFALGRDDATAAAAAVEGVELRRYRQRESDGAVTIDVTYRARDIAALVSFWEPRGTHDATARELVLPLTHDVGTLDADQVALLTELFGTSQYTLQVRLPRDGALTSTSTAVVIERGRGRDHLARVRLSQLVSGPEVVAVVVRY